MDEHILTPEQRQALIEGVWSGDYHSANIPRWLFDALADKLTDSAASGWGNALGVGPIQDQALELALRENLFYFAANKAAHELNDMQQIYNEVKGNKYEFVKAAIKVDELYNRHWLETEATMTERLAQSGREWQSIEAVKSIFPNLRYNAVNDANTRPEHAALDGIVRPVDDTFWSSHFPPLDWNCRCMTESVGATTKVTSLEGVDIPKVDPLFTERVTESKRIWSEKHPYFKEINPPTSKEVEHLVDEKINLTPAETPAEVDKFVRFKTVKQAEAWAVENLNAGYVNYKGIDIEVANDINKSVYDMKKIAPDLRTSGLGSAQKANKAIKEEITAFYKQTSWYKDIVTRFGEEEANKTAVRFASRKVSPVGPNTLAWSYRAPKMTLEGMTLDLSRFNGIYVNEKFAKDVIKLNDIVIDNEKAGFFTKQAKDFGYIMTHEIGHEFDATIGFEKSMEFRTIYERETSKGINHVIENLSKYGATAGGRASHKPAEFIAESWAEFITSPAPRQIATDTGEAMLKVYYNTNKEKIGIEFNEWKEKILKIVRQ